VEASTVSAQVIHFRKEKITCRAAGSGERGLPYRAVPVPEELLEYEYRIPSLMPVCQVQGILARKLEEYSSTWLEGKR